MSTPLFKTKGAAMRHHLAISSHKGRKLLSKELGRNFYLVKLELPVGSGFIQSQGVGGIFYSIRFAKNETDTKVFSGGKVNKIISVTKIK